MFYLFYWSSDSGPEERETTNWCNEKSKPGFSSAKRNSYLKDNGPVVLSPTSSLSKGIVLIFYIIAVAFLYFSLICFIMGTEQGSIESIPSSNFQRWRKMKAWEGLL